MKEVKMCNPYDFSQQSYLQKLQDTKTKSWTVWLQLQPFIL